MSSTSFVLPSVPLPPPTFTAVVDDNTYAIDSAPVVVALAVAALALASLAALVVAAWRRPGALAAPIVPALAMPLFGGVAFLVIVPPHHAAKTRLAADAFRDALVLDAAVVGVGVGVVLAAILVVAIRDAGHVRLLPLALLSVVLGGASYRAYAHARSVERVGVLPHFVVTGLAEMHAGREYDVPVELRVFERRWWIFRGIGDETAVPLEASWRASWHPDAHVHVAARAPGDVSFVARAHKGPVSMSTRLSVRARRELASPLLSLRVGDRFTYKVHVRSSEGALLYFFSIGGGTSPADDRVVEVTGTRERAGFRTFVIETRRGAAGAGDGDRREIEVVALDGETRAFDAERMKIGEQVVAFTGERNGADPVTCAFTLLGATSAVCQRGGRDADVPAPPLPAATLRKAALAKVGVARPPVAFAGAAPLVFAEHTSDGASTFASVLVAVVTIGLVIPPDGSRETVHTLVATRRGPEGAPEALPGGGVRSEAPDVFD